MLHELDDGWREKRIIDSGHLVVGVCNCHVSLRLATCVAGAQMTSRLVDDYDYFMPWPLPFPATV